MIDQGSNRYMLYLTAVMTLALGACAEQPGGQADARHDGHEDHAARQDHSAHAGHGTERDAEGRRLYGMAHQMPPELYEELRQKVALYRNYSNAEIDLSMEMMGAEYQWYISPPELRGDQGVIVLLHGFREHGDRVFRQQVQPMANIFPTSLAIGMSMMMSDHVQLSIDDLEEQGVRKIVVLPVVSSSDNEMYRQWRYIFGHQEEAEYATVPRVKARSAEIVFATPPEDDPLVAEILLDHALEISENPSREVVFIVSHGPTSSRDNEIVVAMLNRMGRMVQADGGFAGAIGLTLQDDAPPEVRAANVEKLRKEVARVQAEGRDVLVVTNLIGSRTIQAKLRSDLAGFEYRFNPKGIVQHDNFTRWMNETLRAALSASPGSTT